LPSPPLTGRVGDWRAGLGRSSCSLLARSFVCECHTISTMPRFQPPPRRTQHADFLALRSPACFAPRLMGPILPERLSGASRNARWPLNSPSVSYSQSLLHRVQPKPCRCRVNPENRQDVSAFALTYILHLRSCKSMDAFVISSLPSLWSETLQAAGPLCSTEITPLHRYYGPDRHPLAFDRLPGCAGYTIYPAPAISRRGEEGFSSCSACPCHRAVASTPPK